MQVPVLKYRENGESELVLLDLDDVIYIRVENRNLVYHTIDDRYEHISTLSDLEQHLHAYGFDLTDKTNLVNMNKIKKLDQKHGKLYFEEHPDAKSKYATVAFMKLKMYGKQIQRIIANNTDSSMEFPMSDGSASPVMKAKPSNSGA
jgi:DNA-binding LytR/AlgR family response regulator